jgi:hypothetical protein
MHPAIPGNDRRGESPSPIEPRAHLCVDDRRRRRAIELGKSGASRCADRFGVAVLPKAVSFVCLGSSREGMNRDGLERILERPPVPIVS